MDVPHSCCVFFSFILERKNTLCHNYYISLMIVLLSQSQNYSIILILQGQRGFLFFFDGESRVHRSDITCSRQSSPAAMEHSGIAAGWSALMLNILTVFHCMKYSIYYSTNLHRIGRIVSENFAIKFLLYVLFSYRLI